ncbi:MAG: hypothetical protein WCB49_00315, partial [Gammaproteobacteria bacterium]
NIRLSMAPLGAESLVAGGKINAASTLFDLLQHGSGLILAKAEFDEAKGHYQTALSLYRKLFDSRDNRIAGVAQIRAIILRYKLHEIDAKIAAEDMSRHIYDWRGERNELAARLSLAQLQAAYGAWPEAMTGLKQAGVLFPNQKVQIDKIRQKMFDKMANSKILGKMSPLAAAALIENNTDLVPSGSAGVPILKILSSKLLDLGLINPAAKIFRSLIDRANNSEIRARLGLDLARIELRSGTLKDAEDALESTESSGISPNLQARRLAMATEISLEYGHIKPIHAVSKNMNAKNLKKLIEISDKNGDFGAEEKELNKLISITIPKSGYLNKSQAKIILQLAIVENKQINKNDIGQLRAVYLRRMPAGAQEALFDDITEKTLRSHSNLTQALHQINTIEDISSRL